MKKIMNLRGQETIKLKRRIGKPTRARKMKKHDQFSEPAKPKDEQSPSKEQSTQDSMWEKKE
jgi:hypothetical protein